MNIPPPTRACRALIAATLLGLGTSASAATLVVTSTANDGPGSLRQALADADPGDTITFDLPTPAQIDLVGMLVIDRNLTIDGPGRDDLILRAASLHRVMSVEAGVTAVLSGLSLRNGSERGGGLRNLGTATLSDCSLRGNDSADENLGGGIFNSGDLTVSACEFDGNIALGLAPAGGGIHNSGTARVERSIFRANGSRSEGGAIHNTGTLTVIDSTFSDRNTADDDGGAIANFATLVVDASTFVGNNADNRGGAIFHFGGTASISNSTLVENDANAGAAIFNNATITVTGSTIARNSAVLGRAIRNFGSIVVSRSIIANTCDNASPVTSAGDNIVFESPPCFPASEALNDRADLDPQLLPLADNGGPTWTRMPAPGSPAIDEVRVNPCEGVDQRGAGRPFGLRCDIGAVEFRPEAMFDDGFEPEVSGTQEG